MSEGRRPDGNHEPGSARDDESKQPAGTGKALGVPYDWRKPTRARVKSRWWNPQDSRVLTPKSFGWGFSFNFYEIGRRLRLIRR